MKKLTILPEALDKEQASPPYLIYFYRHMRKIGHRSYPSFEEAYHIGHYWLRKGRRLYPERKYRFVLGEPVYVLQVIHKKKRDVKVFQEIYTYLQEAEEKRELMAFPDLTYQRIIRIGYEWENYRLKCK